MPLRARRRARHFDVPVHDLMLRITGPAELYEEVRAVGMQFWEQLQSYAIRNPGFQSSKRPFSVAADAPPIVQKMAALSARAGVGPMFTFQGALTESVGQAMSRSIAEINVVCGPDHYIVARKRSRLALDQRAGRKKGEVGIVVKPELGPHGVHISLGNHGGRGHRQDGVVIVATSCILADAAAAGVTAILAKPNSFRAALAYLQRMKGIHGAMLLRGERIGMAGSLELAA
jgi:ApbE superfamily uncharacterized protein (UPF0280 family)